MSNNRWACGKCRGTGMHATDRGQAFCDCEAGERRRSYWSKSADERKAIRSKEKPKPRPRSQGSPEMAQPEAEDAQERIPF